MRYDFHVHSNYSDGRRLAKMAHAAADAGLAGVGFADHCTVSGRPGMQAARADYGFNLDLTYGRRREAIGRVHDRLDLRVFDAVEVDYHPADESLIEAFLAEAGFDYAIGSIHHIDGHNLHVRARFEPWSADEREAVVGTYFDHLVALVDSELFSIAAHPDLVERNPALRGFASRDQYERVADAFAASRTHPEINAGRVTGAYGEFHPSPGFLDALLDRGLEFTVGTDAHRPGEIAERAASIDALLADRGIDPVDPSDVVAAQSA